MKAAIVYKDSKLINDVLDFLSEIGVNVRVFDKPAPDLEDFDFIVSIGGDGTILSILQAVKKCPPIFGINTGRVGLLTHSAPSNFREKLKSAVNNFETEKFMRLCCEANSEILALNEIVMLTAKVAKLITINVWVDGIKVDRIRCDGMIVSTQIGSTGYAFSSGGPIIDPYLESIQVIPLAPFRFGWKPWIVRSDRVIELESEGEALIIADGQQKLKFEGKIIIRKSDYPAVFFKKENRFEELSAKIKKIE